jgi:hypothetical protein
MIENGAQNSCRYSVSVEFAQWLVIKVSVLLLWEKCLLGQHSIVDGMLMECSFD